MSKHGQQEGAFTLGEHPIDVMILATDLGVAREFYGDRIGLGVLIESDEFLTFRCGGNSRLVVTRTATGTSEQTKASLRVNDLAAEVTEVRSRGINVEEYHERGRTAVDGIADVGFALAAWFVDLHRDSIGLLQFKDGGTG